MFVDEVTFEVSSGKGGNGCVAWRREKYVPRGGPDGGDGGRGGDVVLEADEGLSTLLDLKSRRFIRAKNGRPGGGARKTGASAPPKVLRVPVGTQVFDLDTGELVADLVEHGQRAVVAKGGKGGKGNAAFATPTRRSPDFAEPGRPGEQRRIRLTLKLLADVGFVGLPNAGKSTLISRISNARPKVADYPFTTLVPNLGVVQYDDVTFVVADIPGLIEGASEGAGLGTRFLRHVERTALFLFLLDAGPDRPDPLKSLAILERELERHDPAMADRPRIVVLNKCDLPFVAEHAARVQAEMEKRGVPFFEISAATGQGVRELVAALARLQGRD